MTIPLAGKALFTLLEGGSLSRLVIWKKNSNIRAKAYLYPASHWL